MGISQLQYTDNNSPRNIFIVGVGLYLVRGPCSWAPYAHTRALQCCVLCCIARASCSETVGCPLIAIDLTAMSSHH